MLIKCPAKINLQLRVGARDKKGFHQLESVFWRWRGLEDEIKIEPSTKKKGGILTVIDEAKTHLDEMDMESNLVWKAKKLLEEKTGKRMDWDIILVKRIPAGSGLGGGSSDAAEVLRFLNEAEALNIENQMLLNWAAELGKDVPFFLSAARWGYGENYGEKVTPWADENAPRLEVEIVDIQLPIQTAQAFADWDRLGLRDSGQRKAVVQKEPAWTAQKWVENLHNDFEKIPQHAARLAQLRTQYKLAKNEQFLLAGSGGAIVKISALSEQKGS